MALTLGVVPNLRKPELEVSIRAVIEWAERTGSSLLMSEAVTEKVPDVPEAGPVRIMPEEEAAGEADLLLAMGGDGTILAAMRHARERGLPVLGVNLGSLGFLADVGPEKLLPALDRLESGDHEIEERMTLEAEIRTGGEVHLMAASNDIVIDKGAYSRVIDIDAQVDGEYLQRYTGDGLILSTPGGSTAYALAAGGPIVNPAMDAMLAVPICPHTLAARAVVLGGESRVQLTVFSKHGTAQITGDGQERLMVASGDTLEIRQGAHRNRLVRTGLGLPFYDVLRKKLKLGFREPAERS
ncbi:MAG: NAD(+)/NADH kinase [bacterium]